MASALLAAVLALHAAAPPSRVAGCKAERAARCEPAGCVAITDGLEAERFEVDLARRRVEACLYTDCFSGPATVVRDPERPWVVTAFGLVRSSRPRGATPPPGASPFPLTVTVDLRTGRFTATWGSSPEGQQTDFGACELGAGR